MARDWLTHPEGLVGSVLGGRYRVTSVLGRGPMGIACEGESSRGRHVTLKLLPRPTDLQVEHFAWQVRQTLALAHFDHPNVSPINDFGALEDGSAFVSRSRVPGATLRTMLRQGPLPVRRALELGRQIALALSAAHSQDIAHGRLKPENILVQTHPNGGDQVKVVDFGMAELPVNVRAVAPDENDARRLLLRTRLYLPNSAAAAASPAIDVYALGVILFEMIAGQPPFAFESIGAAGPEAQPITFAQCQPPIHVPAAIGDLVLSLLHPRADLQGITAGHLVKVLDALLGRPSAPLAQAPAPAPELASSAPHAGPVSLEPPPPTVKGPPPDLGPASAGGDPPFADPARQGGNLVPSWPPLPQGFSTSSVPPPPPSSRGRGSSLNPTASVASGTYPPGGYPGARGLPPDYVSAAPSPSSMPPPSSIDTDDEAEFRPSLLSKLRRLFGGKRGEGF